MLKSAMFVTAIIVITGTSVAFAQQNSDGFEQRGEHNYRPSAADMAAFTDARIAALRAGLELTPDQAKSWPSFEQALRDAAQLRMQDMQARERQAGERQTSEQPHSPANPFARLEQRADNLAKMSSALKKVADAGTPLYQSLTEGQKQRFAMLARMLRLHWMGTATDMMGRGMMGGGMTGDGMMGGGMMDGGMTRHGMMGHGMIGDQDCQD
jgi:zinc resistance-associated protein